MNAYSEILNQIATGPDTQIDASVKPRLVALAGDPAPKADTLHDILDDIVHASLASDFVVGVLNYVWAGLLAAEGRTVEEALRQKHYKKAG